MIVHDVVGVAALPVPPSESLGKRSSCPCEQLDALSPFNPLSEMRQKKRRKIHGPTPSSPPRRNYEITQDAFASRISRGPESVVYPAADVSGSSSSASSSTEGESGLRSAESVVDGQQVRRVEKCLEPMFEYERYGAEVTHAILPGKARTINHKSVPVPETDTGSRRPKPRERGRNYNVLSSEIPCRKEEASLFPGLLWPFLRSLGGRRRRPPSGARAINLRPRTVSVDSFYGVGLPKGNGACKGFLGRTEIGPRVQRQKELDCKTHPSTGRNRLSDPTVPSGRPSLNDKSYSRITG
nr:BnaUnng00830D [Ipomoea trifida]